MNLNKLQITICFLLFSFATFAQPILAETTNVDPSGVGGTFDVDFTSNTDITGVDLISLKIWLRVLDADAPITVTFDSNPYGLGEQFAPTSFGGYTYYAYQSLTGLPPTTFPSGVPVNVAMISISEDVTVELVGGQAGAGSGSNYPGTSIVQGTTNLVAWPINADAALPTKLTSFTALKFEDIHSKLDWTSSSEINASHFEVERSTNTNTWVQVGLVKAAGESTTLKSYEFVDRNVGTLRSSTTFYYRLKMVDNDGSFEYSAVRSITFAANGVTINVYPNPTTDRLSIDMTSEIDFNNGAATAYLRDNNGKVMLKNTISTNGVTEISMNDVPSGMFLLQVEHNNKVYTQKVIKID